VPVPPELLEILRCLECRSRLEDADDELVCTGCGLRYPVEGDIPVMLREAAYREEDSQ
jgi:uncharacterized protein YbaR (Trm112 family)